MGCITRHGSSGFGPMAAQAAAVALADVLRHGFIVSGDQSPSAFSAEQLSPQNAAYPAAALDGSVGSISPEYSRAGTLPQHDHFQLHNMLSDDRQCGGQFVSSSRRANLDAKSKVCDMQSQVLPAFHSRFQSAKDYERQLSNSSTASSDGAPHMENNHTSDDDFDKSNEGGPDGSDEHPSSRTVQASHLTDAAGLIVKNTFLEFVPQKPFVGLRPIATAAGRLESLGEE
mmetsp:Transcript_93874/g.172106  ORF Transcript_93874/g.172106 Transcript_93874/m.172106 type:complete len:229 (+) Transcript_93874:2-688(+)